VVLRIEDLKCQINEWEKEKTEKEGGGGGAALNKKKINK